jgi:hypothetical protein
MRTSILTINEKRRFPKANTSDWLPGEYQLAVTPDVLVISIPLVHGIYPSRNAENSGSGRYSAKNQSYAKLFATVEAAAREAVNQGWKTINTHCDFYVTRYVRDERQRDAANIASCEANGLTRGGAWTDDSLAAPAHFDIQCDPEGEDRISIIIMRRFQHQIIAREARPQAKKIRRLVSKKRGTIVSDTTPEVLSDSRVATANGVPMTKAETKEALEKYFASGQGKRRR